jgi:predicted PurR-regulated permease PerM
MNEHSIDFGPEVIVEGRPRVRARALKLNFNPRWLWGALVVLLSGGILRSFFEPLVWASVIAVATWPIYRRFAQRLPGRVASNVTPLLFTVLVSLFVLGPMVFAFGALVSEAHRWIDQIVIADKTGLASPAWLETLPLVGAKLAERWQEQLGTPGGVSVLLQRADTSAAFGWAQTLGQFMAHHLFIVVFTILVLFFLYRGGDALALRVNHLLHDSLGDRGESYVELAIRAVRATVNGMVVVALFDGVLTGITYALAGVQRAEIWGAVTGLFAMIPFLGYAAVAGVALALAARGAVMAALVVCGLGLAVLFAGDKIVRPMLVGGAVRLGFVWVLMGSLGGLELLGLLGLFVGPVVLALGGALWHDWTTNRGRSRVTRVSAAVTEPA